MNKDVACITTVLASVSIGHSKGAWRLVLGQIETSWFMHEHLLSAVKLMLSEGSYIM